VFNAFAVGLGLTLTMVVFSSLKRRIDEKAVPASFRGLPISLLIAGLMALALLAFKA
jgi:electron transport complex protein RnfA